MISWTYPPTKASSINQRYLIFTSIKICNILFIIIIRPSSSISYDHIIAYRVVDSAWWPSARIRQVAYCSHVASLYRTLYSPGLSSYQMNVSIVIDIWHHVDVEHKSIHKWDHMTLWDLHGKIPASNPAVSILHTHCQPLKIYSIYSS